MNIQLHGRVALVTGGSKGIGLEIARTLGKAGARLVIAARGAEALEQARQALAEYTGVLAVQTDVTREADIQHLIETSIKHYGQLDILINNAVTSVQNTFRGLSEEDWQLHLNTKLLGYVRTSRHAVPHLAQSKAGRIINLGGMSARHVTDYRMTNGVVNAAVSNFSKHLSHQVGKQGITVNTIHPGFTRTPRLESMLQRLTELENKSRETVEAEQVAQIPVGRFIEPADIANLVTFLVSDHAAAISGQAIAVDGGSGPSIPY